MRGRGGSGNRYHQAVPSDTLDFRITNVTQAVTRDILQQVCGTIQVMPRTIVVYPTTNPTEVSAQVVLNSVQDAEKVLTNFNGKSIYNDGNTMHIQYGASAAAQNAGVMGAGAVLPAPMPQGQPQQQQQQQQQMPQAPFYGAPGQMYGQQPQIGAQFPAGMPGMPPQGMPGYPQMMPGMPGMPGMTGMPPQMMGQAPFTPGFNPNYMPRGGRGGMLRGARGGRGMGRGGAGFDPMVAGGAGMPFNPMMYPVAGGMMMPGGNMGQDPHAPTVFVSVVKVPDTEPLQSIFTLMEAFGGVVSIRRNQKNKDILAVKMASTEDAEQLTKFLRRVPYAGGTVSGRKFPSYVDRHPCTDEGDPNDVVTVQFDFTASRHRSPGQRSKCAPSNRLKITGCTKYAEADVMSYLNGKGFFPESITKEEDGSFTVQVDSAETAVKLLIACHGDVCSEERSNVIFVEGTEQPAEGDNAEAKNAAANTMNEEGN